MGFLLKNWRLFALIAAALAVLWYFRHYGDVRYAAGYGQAAAEQKTVADAQAIQNAQKERDDAKRIADAYQARQSAEAELAAIRARPVPALVCHRAASRPRVLPETARLPDTPPANAGPLPAGAGESFDPSVALTAMADEADSLLADCRMLHQAVHGVPTAP